MEKNAEKSMEFKMLKESRMGRGAADRERFHRYHELFYIAEGSCSVFVGQRTYRLKSGNFVLIPAGTLHKTDFLSSGQNTKFVISFSRKTGQLVDEFLGEEVTKEAMRPGKIKAPVQRQEALSLLLNRMLYEYESSPAHGRAMFLCCLAQLLISLVRYRAGEEEPDGMEDPKLGRMQQVASYLCEHAQEPLSLEEVASHFALSPSHLSRSFRQATGFGFREYLIHYRIQRACDLLLNTELSVTEIADRCGFSDSNYFGDAFRKATGLSPRAYRKLS